MDPRRPANMEMNPMPDNHSTTHCPYCHRPIRLVASMEHGCEDNFCGDGPDICIRDRGLLVGPDGQINDDYHLLAPVLHRLSKRDPEADMLLHCAGEALDSGDPEAVAGAEAIIGDLDEVGLDVAAHEHYADLMAARVAELEAECGCGGACPKCEATRHDFETYAAWVEQLRVRKADTLPDGAFKLMLDAVRDRFARLGEALAREAGPEARATLERMD